MEENRGHAKIIKAATTEHVTEVKLLVVHRHARPDADDLDINAGHSVVPAGNGSMLDIKRTAMYCSLLTQQTGAAMRVLQALQVIAEEEEIFPHIWNYH